MSYFFNMLHSHETLIVVQKHKRLWITGVYIFRGNKKIPPKFISDFVRHQVISCLNEVVVVYLVVVQLTVPMHFSKTLKHNMKCIFANQNLSHMKSSLKYKNYYVLYQDSFFV